jgi:hypothetical protein
VYPCLLSTLSRCLFKDFIRYIYISLKDRVFVNHEVGRTLKEAVVAIFRVTGENSEMHQSGLLAENKVGCEWCKMMGFGISDLDLIICFIRACLKIP